MLVNIFSVSSAVISVLEMVTGIVRFHIEVVCPLENVRLVKSRRPSSAAILQQLACGRREKTITQWC
jgi:hypothetical protein